MKAFQLLIAAALFISSSWAAKQTYAIVNMYDDANCAHLVSTIYEVANPASCFESNCRSNNGFGFYCMYYYFSLYITHYFN